MKRILLSIFVALLATTALWAYDFKSGNLYYYITSDSTAKVTYQDGQLYYVGLTSVVIPESVTYNGTTYRVTSIGDWAFQYCDDLTSITIPNSITSIGLSAFNSCSSLTSVTIPNSVTSIGDYAFYGCSKLTSVTIPNSVTSIGGYAFSGCSRLRSITIPNSVTSIESSTFEDCTSITSVVWNAKSCEDFSSSSSAPFYNIYGSRSQITSFTFGDEVEHIPAYLCYGMESLTSITIPNSVTSIGKSAFEGCSKLRSITIPNGVTSIESNVFSGCTGLTSVTIPNNVTSIGSYAFYGCSGLTSVTIPNSVTSIRDHAFCRCWQLMSVTIPDSVTSIENGTFIDCSSLTSITIPNSVTSIGDWAFDGCSGLTSVTIPNSVTSIGKSAFEGCRGMTSVTIPNSVTNIGLAAFKGCSGMTSVTIPDGVTSIENRTFSDCSALTSIAIPDGVTNVGDSTFYDCSSLTSVTIGNSVTNIGESAFRGCNGLTSVVWEARNCKDFTSSSTPFYYSNRSNKDFDLRSQITSFVFGDSVQHIPAYICTGMEKLTSITIPNNVTSIGDNEFASCSKLTTVTIGNGVTNIGEKAFQGCSNLETVIFGSGLQNIGDNAFQGCQNIYEMTVYATQVPNVVAEKDGSTSYGTFQGVSKLAELHVPAESVKKYKIHPVWGLFNVITAIPYTVTLLCDNVQGAVVGSGSYQPNEQVTITAKANAGYRFVQWNDGITTNPRTIVVTSDTILTAEFEEIPASEYTVSVVVDPAQHGAVQITLTAVPDAGYQFARWSDGNTENPRTILIKENMTLSATFNLSTKANNASAEDSQDGTRKVFRNGQMYIIRGDKTYTATGAQL